MAQMKQSHLDDLLASSEALSDSDLELGEDELKDVFGDEASTDNRGTRGDFGLKEEDFSLEGDLNAVTGRSRTPSHNIELLMEVELNVVIVLGRTRKTIREVLRFTPGSVIELDKMAGDTVDVLVNDRLIAKGEVIVLDESLGVRITSIVTPEEFIKGLR